LSARREFSVTVAFANYFLQLIGCASHDFARGSSRRMTFVDLRSFDSRWLLTLAALSVFAPGCAAGHDDDASTEVGDDARTAIPPGLERSANVALGIPHDRNGADDLLLDRTEYVVSYNEHTRTPNWVAWRLIQNDLGNTDRALDFSPDAQLPEGVYRVNDEDYLNTGFDRGHMCPSADRTRNAAMNKETFLFTNVVPQRPSVNRGPWKALESHERDLARAGRTLYIVAGPLFAANPPTVGQDVSVPRAFFKVIVSLPDANLDSIDRADVVSVLMDNDESAAASEWPSHAVRARAVQDQSGYTLFGSLPPSARRHLLDADPALGESP
jgi:endonuclease G